MPCSEGSSCSYEQHINDSDTYFMVYEYIYYILHNWNLLFSGDHLSWELQRMYKLCKERQGLMNEVVWINMRNRNLTEQFPTYTCETYLSNLRRPMEASLAGERSSYRSCMRLQWQSFWSLTLNLIKVLKPSRSVCWRTLHNTLT